MDTSTVHLKQCNRKEKCVNPLGSWLPATLEYFCIKRSNKGGLNGRCNVCNHVLTAQWRSEHPDYTPEYNKQYRADNAEQIKANKSADYFLKRDYYLAQFKAYYLAHREAIRLYRQGYHAEHPEIARIGRRNRRARLKLAGGVLTAKDIDLQIRAQTDKRGKLRCWWHGEVIEHGYHIDHVIPLDKGGRNDAGNIVISCPRHNLEKHDKLPSEYGGWLF